MYAHILIATDGSPLSSRAVDQGLALAAALRANVTILHATHVYPMSYIEGGLAAGVADAAKVEAAWRESAEHLLSDIKAKARALDIHAEAEIVTSDYPAEAIRGVADRKYCDLIVMASHGRRGLKRLLLGSETLDVLTHSKIPTLVVR